MKFFKAIVLACVALFALTSQAGTLSDDEYMEYNSAITDTPSVAVIKKYVTKDASLVNYKFYAWEPLQMASEHNNLEVVKFLIEHGADKDYAHPLSKMTAFHLAAFDGHKEVVKYLASAGVDINKKMKGGVSLIRVVQDEGNTEMVELLKKLGVSEEGCTENCF